jgi:hypothetical protein
MQITEGRRDAFAAELRAHQALVGPRDILAEPDPHPVEVRQRVEREPAVAGHGVARKRGHAEIAARIGAGDAFRAQIEIGLRAQVQHVRLGHQPQVDARRSRMRSSGIERPGEDAEHPHGRVPPEPACQSSPSDPGRVHAAILPGGS